MITAETMVGQRVRRQEANVQMDMAFLVERLEAVVAAGRRVPFGRVLLDEQEVMEIVDQMRDTQPVEINQARRILQEREQIITQAQGEAERIVTMARDRVEQLLDEDGVLLAAKAEAEQILADARADADAMRAEIDIYAAEILTFLEEFHDKNLTQVRNGLQHLRPALRHAEPTGD